MKKDGSEKILGLNTLFCRKIFIKGHEYTAAIAGDFFVAHRHRSLGPAMMLHKKAIAATHYAEIDFIYGFPNQKAEGVIKRAGYQYLGDISRLVKLINFKPYLKSKGISESVCRIIAPVLNGANHLASIHPFCNFKRDILCKKITRTDERFDKLWVQAKGQFTAIGERSSRYLQWRYLSQGSGVIFAATDKKNQQLYGYIACTINDDSLNIRDFFIPRQSAVATCLLQAVVKYGCKISVRSININLLMNETVESFFRKYGFAGRKHDRKIFVYASHIEKSDQNIIGDVNNWLFLSGDNDC